MMRKALRAFF